MPLFSINQTALSTVDQINFSAEQHLQSLIEKNLPTVFGCRFVASEFATGQQHSGRIDTLALSEDNNPVIIEYKKVKSSELINQSLFYLSWIQDHHGDFKIAAQKELGSSVVVDWSNIRVICLAPNYKKYDLHAVQVIGLNIELWTYRLYNNGSLYLDEVLQESVTTAGSSSKKRLTATQKANVTKKTGAVTVDQHFEGKPKGVQGLARSVQEFLFGLDPSMKEIPNKYYLAYKISQNIACMEIQTKRVLLYVKLDPNETGTTRNFSRDVTKIGHYGTGNLELSLKTVEDFDLAKPLLELAYQRIGG
jgi:predicted transport protein